jgi:hypothetical protein
VSRASQAGSSGRRVFREPAELARRPLDGVRALVGTRQEREADPQSQPQNSDPRFFSTHWALWRVGLDGSLRRLTHPPRGSADESPRFSRTGDVLLFVRMRRGNGMLYALRGTRTVGPLLFLGNNIGYYGHHDWWLTAEWSLAR